MAGIEKDYEITEVYAWQWDGNTNITIEDIPKEKRNEITMLKVERSIKTSCKKCGKSNKECFQTTIEEYDMYKEILCEDCLTEILDKKITAIKPKKIE